MYKNSSAFRQRFPHPVSGSNYSEPSSSHSLLSCGQQMNTNTNNTYENQSFLYNPKHFWNCHKVFLGGRSGANSTISSNREVAGTPAGKAELFNKYFCFVFLPTTFGLNNSEYATSSSITDMEISQIEVSVDEVKERLSDLDTTKAYGPDKIPARLLKECSEQIDLSRIPLHWVRTIAPERGWGGHFHTFTVFLSTLTSTWRYCLLECFHLTEGKSADVPPIHKRDAKEAAENYCLISLLSIVSKVLQRCVGNRFYTYVKDLISALQHGFLPNRSCITQLLSALHSIGQS